MTNAARYRVLHDAAADLLDRLADDYDVERLVWDGAGLDEDLARGAAVEKVERLRPTHGGAPLTIAFSAFPGLLVRYGEWHVEAYPRCGCDACDEQPAELAQALVTRVERLVAGGFMEELTGGCRPGVAHAFSSGASGWTRITRAEVRRLGGRARRRWPAWTRP